MPNTHFPISVDDELSSLPLNTSALSTSALNASSSEVSSSLDVPDADVALALKSGDNREWRRLRAVVEAQIAIAQAGLDLNAVMNIIVERMQDITRAAGSMIELVDGEEMVYRAASGSARDFLGLRVRQAATLSGRCVNSGEILRCDDAETDLRVDREACRKLGALSMIVVPLCENEQVVGVLKVLSPRAHAFIDEDVQTLQLMSSLVGNVMSQAREFEWKQLLLAQRAQTLDALRESEERFRNSFDAAAIGKAIVGVDGRWIEVNHAICEMLGYSERELFSRTFQDITFPDDLTTDLKHFQETLAGTRRNYQMEKRYFHKEGRIVWVLLCVSLVRDRDGEPLYFVSEIIDITPQKNALQLLLQSYDEMQSLALFDSLTGIHNRRAFDQRLLQEIEYSKHGNEKFSLILFDLDHFKLHNDSFGHASGDQILRGVGHLLRTELHPRDFSARYGGEEFALILPRTDHHGALRVAEKLHRAFNEFPWQNGALTASFGVSTVDSSSLNAQASVLIEKADRALYAAKAKGRNRICCAETIDT